MTFSLPSLPYAKDALEPYMSARTLDLHHGKHHQTYINNLNKIIENTDYQSKTLEQIVQESFGKSESQGLFNNSGQHWNHNLFWSTMKAQGGGDLPEVLARRIVSDFGTVESFKQEFIATGLGQFGSGWCWLIVDPSGRLHVTKTPNAENPLVHGQIALLGCDVWEHSYYLDYQNRRGDYLNAFLENLVDWEIVVQRLQAAA